jgi:O-antigen ligase
VRSSKLEQVVAGLLTVAILTVAAGSAWRADIKTDVRNLRWVALLSLCAASLALARRCAPRMAVTALERRGAVLVSIVIALFMLSAAWSVAARLTLERGFTVLLVLVTASALGFSAARAPRLVPLCARAILAAIGLLLLASLVLAVFDTGAALQPDIVRFRGIAENPDTLPLLAAYGLPLGSWLTLESTHRVERAVASTLMAAIVVLLGATGSRGGIVAGVAGLAVVVWLMRSSLALGAVAVAGVVLVLGASLALTPLMAHLPGAQQRHAVPGQAVRALAVALPGPSHHHHRHYASGDQYNPGPLADELGFPGMHHRRTPLRNLFSSSGRLQAWAGAIHQADQRPLLGYGFGTEDRVFTDRWYAFEGDRPENGPIGIYLQVGLIGLLAVVALVGWSVMGGVRTVARLPRERRPLLAAVAGVVAAGLVETLFQSFAVSAGDIAMLTFWVSLGLFATSAEWAQP